ncbi:alpha-galactosidase [soil metagenome]
MMPVLQSPPAVFDNGLVRLTVSRFRGACDLKWRDGATLDNVSGEARLADGRVLRTYDYPILQIASRKVRDGFGSGTEVIVTHSGGDRPALRHVFWIYNGRPETFARLEIVGSATGSNYLAPVVAPGFRLAKGKAKQSLYVPYDNDGYARYRSDCWEDKDESYEVGAAYEDGSRNGLVVGSVDHDVWKSAVKFRKSGLLVAYAGASSEQTRDKVPHGSVTGREIRSPRMMLGSYADWRDGMEHYGDANAIVQPPLRWKGPVPFGWNSWGGYKSKITDAEARFATDFVKNELPGFRSGGTATINFDSFWDNLTKEQRKAFVDHAHSLGLKAGIYYTPFTYWGEPDWKADNTTTLAREIMVKDALGNPLPKFSGGYALDPTHPFVQARIRRQLDEFVKMGFDYLKMDFLTHGAVEGQHYDPKVQTGTQAYIQGMKGILDYVSEKRIGRPFFVSLSIAPLFPQGLGHSRRVSCDVFSNIGASEYLLNSSTYGWWAGGRLYRFNDPDHTVAYQAQGEEPSTEVEGHTRMTASVITGGMLLDGDALTDLNAQRRVKSLFTNSEVLKLAREAVPFRPVGGETGDKAGEAFIRMEKGGKTAYVAVFNYDRNAACTITLPFPRLGLAGEWVQTDLWTGQSKSVSGTLVFELPSRDCALVRLKRIR